MLEARSEPGSVDDCLGASSEEANGRGSEAIKTGKIGERGFPFDHHPTG